MVGMLFPKDKKDLKAFGFEWFWKRWKVEVPEVRSTSCLSPSWDEGQKSLNLGLIRWNVSAWNGGNGPDLLMREGHTSLNFHRSLSLREKNLPFLMVSVTICWLVKRAALVTRIDLPIKEIARGKIPQNTGQKVISEGANATSNVFSQFWGSNQVLCILCTRLTTEPNSQSLVFWNMVLARSSVWLWNHCVSWAVLGLGIVSQSLHAKCWERRQV